MSEEIEYYIRTADSEEARGPYPIDHLQSLAEAGKVDRDTLIFDESMEVWVEIGKHETLLEQIFPERKKLTLKQPGQAKAATKKAPVEGEEEEEEEEAGEDEKKQEDKPTAKVSSDTDEEGNELPEHDVSEMLLAAEGQTEDTEHLKRKQERMHAAASLSLPGLGLIMLLSAFVLIYPNYQTIQVALSGEDEGGYLALLDPMIIIGLLDLIFAAFLLLAVSEIFPAIRLRSALGLGFWGFIFWAGGDPILMALAIAGHLSLFICTMTLNLYLMMAGLVLGVLSFGMLSYLAFTGSLFYFI